MGHGRWQYEEWIVERSSRIPRASMALTDPFYIFLRFALLNEGSPSPSDFPPFFLLPRCGTAIAARDSRCR